MEVRTVLAKILAHYSYSITCCIGSDLRRDIKIVTECLKLTPNDEEISTFLLRLEDEVSRILCNYLVSQRERVHSEQKFWEFVNELEQLGVTLVRKNILRLASFTEHHRSVFVLRRTNFGISAFMAFMTSSNPISKTTSNVTPLLNFLLIWLSHAQIPHISYPNGTINSQLSVMPASMSERFPTVVPSRFLPLKGIQYSRPFYLTSHSRAVLQFHQVMLCKLLSSVHNTSRQGRDQHSWFKSLG